MSRKILLATAVAFLCSAFCVRAQVADTVRTQGQVPPPVSGTMPDSLFRITSPEEAAFVVRMADDHAVAERRDTIVPGEPPRALTRKERRQLRKAGKDPVQEVPQAPRYFKVTAGSMIRPETPPEPDSLSLAMAALADSLYMMGEIPLDSLLTMRGIAADSLLRERGIDADSVLLAQGIRQDSVVGDSVRYEIFRGVYETVRDSLLTVRMAEPGERDTMTLFTAVTDSLSVSRRELRRIQKAADRADSTLYTHNPYFRDTLSHSRFTLISLVVPGFGQFYNRQAWKIPVAYGVAGTALYFGIRENRQYKKYAEVYDYRIGGGFPREMVDPIQNNMIIHNTRRQLLYGAAIGSYIYLMADALINYPSENVRVKNATWLSVVCPGAGQIYNKSYWRVPWVVGGAAAFLYVVDRNDRFYQRYKRAIEYETDGDPTTSSDIVGDVNTFQTAKDSARRNRDLAIILTGVWYLFNIMDANVDAYLKDFDVSDSLAWRLEPHTETLYTHWGRGPSVFGLSLSYTFF